MVVAKTAISDFQLAFLGLGMSVFEASEVIFQQMKRQSESESNDCKEQTQNEEDEITNVSKQSFMFGSYTGQWHAAERKPHGVGKWYKFDILRYDGHWEYGQWCGQGTVYDEDGIRVCSGNYLNGEPHGFATLYKEDGETIELSCYHIFGKEFSNIKNDEEFLNEVHIIQSEQEQARKKQRVQACSSSTIESFSFKFDHTTPLLSAPLIGIFPRYETVPVKLLEGCALNDLDDDEIPTPTNLGQDKTREDWLAWVRTHFPRNTT